MAYSAEVTARLGISGVFECKNAQGEVIKTITMTGSIPLSDLGMSEDDAKQLIEKGTENGTNDCK